MIYSSVPPVQEEKPPPVVVMCQFPRLVHSVAYHPLVKMYNINSNNNIILVYLIYKYYFINNINITIKRGEDEQIT